MTTQTDLQPRLNALAGTKRQCECKGQLRLYRYGPDSTDVEPDFCELCDGTGQVFLFPDAIRVFHAGRDRCPDPECGDSTWDHDCQLGGHQSCCNGLGYTASDRLEVWMDIIDRMVISWEIYRRTPVKTIYVELNLKPASYSHEVEWNHPLILGKGSTVFEAFVSALEQAVAAREVT